MSAVKVGLLECDHVRDELRHIAGDYRQMFPALFLNVAPEWEFQFYDVCNGHFPPSVDACDIYICTGSKSSVYDQEDWITRLKAFVISIHQSQKTFIGVCFGHQILGEALGGKVEKSPAGWCVGVHRFQLTKRESWMEPFTDSFNLLMMCQDQVMTLPPDATLLAETPDCPHAMFRVGERMLGIQAHPEFPKAYDQALMELRVERIGENKVELGIASLELPTQEIMFAHWIKNFSS
ncbi:glutamine amidotransferase-related protein [Dyadobacter fanqingshengii]|uniref:Amidotransferase n=1 Tax=Dyadobacter fanqingshengii TaxID=2906443 RepID=A0A9X1P5K5_9BACT|nr:amidotransferase [Dyadobacter fanqingshengii]MCF0039166.1 amidotransferase [Dyadobacter fanqingshengii]USJ34014.1 amidotransferase [Dyadobacter fanqingshengii]